MRNCHAVINGGGSTEYVLSQLRKMEAEYPKRFIKRVELFSDTKKYYLYGISNSIDIVATLRKRFETGSGHNFCSILAGSFGDLYEMQF